ncbi:GNAT family N-acetyltransferase [Acidovorax sp. LjRoot74]|uniref:GNAT family N-acetyltransferase n=1 Tax=unclassified Acidovorax TaxID=2684926 RepID=UPI0025B85068|nr:GNAT family N-acetyltransferase [Acidovorax sp.]MBW8461300.1 GNAT family N-acetyltransferase [Acidovorax sp.]
MEPTVRAITVDEAFDAPVFAALCAEYQAESLRNPCLMGALPDRQGYTHLAEAGVLRPLGVFVGDELAGFCAVLITPVLHFAGRVIASTETLFVAQAHRAGGAGLMLLHAAEDVAVRAGAGGLYVTAPAGGRLERLLPHVGYHTTNLVFFRGLK